MKQKFFTSTTLVLAFLLLLNSSFINAVKAPGGEYYQLTIYHCKTADQLRVINAYLKNTYLPALHKTGLTNIGVFSSIDNDTATDKRLYVLMRCYVVIELKGGKFKPEHLGQLGFYLTAMDRQVKSACAT